MPKQLRDLNVCDSSVLPQMVCVGQSQEESLHELQHVSVADIGVGFIPRVWRPNPLTQPSPDS